MIMELAIAVSIPRAPSGAAPKHARPTIAERKVEQAFGIDQPDR